MARRYGQHFLKDPKIVERIVAASGVGPDDAVLEIGPGRGILTRELAKKAKKVLAIEIDRALFAALKESGLPANVEVRLGDALALPEEEIVTALGADYRVVANLPYDITSSFLQRFLTLKNPPRDLTLMLQKEVGERIVAKDGKQSRLALFCGYYSNPEILFSVPRGAFSPPPKVDSTIIRLTLAKKKWGLTPGGQARIFECEKRLFAIIDAGFSQKRRNLRNSLSSILGASTESSLISAGINPSKRPEEISLFEWMTLAERM